MRFSIFLVLPFLFSMSHHSVHRHDSKVRILNRVEPLKCIQALDKVSFQKKYADNFKATTELENAFIVCLSDYIKIQTVSPKGHEDAAVEYLKPIFEHYNIPTQTQYVDSFAEGEINKGIKRINLIATLSKDRSDKFNWAAKADTKSVILLNHMDVVGVKDEQWVIPDLAFSGRVMKYPGSDSPEKFLWGRGAIDMKGLGILQMISMILLKNSNDELKNDLHFVAVADEESGGSGARGLLNEMGPGKAFQNLSKVKVVLNEGGGAAKGIPGKDDEIHLIGSEEKGGAWLEVKHRDPAKLLEWLYSKHFFNHKKKALKRDKKFKNYYCKIYRFDTPNAKVNVVTSIVNVDLYCEGVTDRDKFIKEVFIDGNGEIEYSYDKGRHLSFSLKAKSSSHGSIGTTDHVLEALAVGLHRIGTINLKRKRRQPKNFKYVYTDNTKTFIKELGRKDKTIKRISKLTFLPFVRKLLLKELEKEFGIDGLFRTNCTFSALKYKQHKAEALVDCRLLHTLGVSDRLHADLFVEEIMKKNKDNELKVKLSQSWNVTSSTASSMEFEIISRTIKQHSPEASVVPYLFPAGSDNTWFRDPKSTDIHDVGPILSFGYVPVFYNEDIIRSVHGANERFPLDKLGWSLRVYPDIVRNLLMSEE